MKFKKVVVGGTFDFLHKGHKALLSKAFEVGEHVIIGLTSEKMKNQASPFEKRKEKLEAFIKNKGEYEIIEIFDPYSIAIDMEELEAIVVSKETKARAKEINEIRKKKGLKPLKIIEIPMVLAYDGKPISSTRIRRGEIREDGSKKSKKS